MTHLSEFRCTLHNINFSAEVESSVSHLVGCPLCLNKENSELREEVNRLRLHRDALLAAIEIKKTVELLKS